MQCPACAHGNRDSARFCEQCGAPLPRACAGCGTLVRPGARFCDACGRPLAAEPAPAVPAPPSADPVPALRDRLRQEARQYTPRHLAEKILTSRSALEGERKQVTVLFADCADFTGLAARVDLEDLHRIMDGCFQRLLDSVHGYEGTVNQFTGDGVMALFGAPIAHEDHGVRAVAAALDIQERMRAYAELLRRDSGVDFQMRIGINTGPVVVGKIGDDLRMDYTAQGETVNLAARLQQAAPPGGVLVSEATHRLVGGYFGTRDAGALSLKGFERPVQAFAVTARRSRRGRFDLAVERGLTPLVGRGRELAFLSDSWARARGGRGQVVSLVGEAGVGKTRLAYELARSLDDVARLQGRCLPHTASVPFHLVIEFLQASFLLHDGDDERRRAEKVEEGVRALDPALDWAVPYVKHLLALPAESIETDGLDQAQRRRRMIDAVKALVVRRAQRGPLLLAAQDLQWIDRNSEEFFQALVDGLAGLPVLLLCTYRTGYAPPWQERSLHHRLTVDPLSAEEAAAMTDALLGTAGAAAALRDKVIERAEGNPFFIEELTRYLRESGERAAGGDLPETVQALLAARIDRLPDPLKGTLQVASVLGREFPLSLLEALAPVADLKDQVGELVRLELLREKEMFPQTVYSFAHLLVQEAAYQGLLLKSRGELHGRAAAALEALYAGRLEEVVPEIAEHYVRSPDRAGAVRYLVLAGDRAARLFAYDEAAAHYARALDRLSPAETDQRVRVLDRLGDAAFASGALPEARARFEDGLTHVAAGTDRPLAAALHRKMGTVCWAGGEKEAALRHLEAALAALGDDTDNLEAARLYQEFGRLHFRLGDHARAVDSARRALALGEALGAPDVVSHAYNTWGVAVARGGDLEEGADLVRRSLDAALAHQLWAVACRAYTNLAVMYSTLDHERSAEYCREGLALAKRIGDQLQEAWLCCTLASGHCTLAGDYDEGVRAAETAAELDERLGQKNHLPIPLIILAQIHQCRGSLEESARYYRKALAVAESLSEPQLLVPCYEGLGIIAIEEGDEAGAETWLEKSRSIQEATGWTSEAFQILPFLC